MAQKAGLCWVSESPAIASCLSVGLVVVVGDSDAFPSFLSIQAKSFPQPCAVACTRLMIAPEALSSSNADLEVATIPCTQSHLPSGQEEGSPGFEYESHHFWLSVTFTSL